MTHVVSLLKTHRLALLAAVVILGWVLVAFTFIRDTTVSGCAEVRAYHTPEVHRYEEVLAIDTLNSDVRTRLNHELAGIKSGPCWY